MLYYLRPIKSDDMKGIFRRRDFLEKVHMLGLNFVKFKLPLRTKK